MGLLCDYGIFTFDNPSFDIHGLKYLILKLF